MHLQPEFAQEVDILMEEERLVMHNWEGPNIFQNLKRYNKSKCIRNHTYFKMVFGR
jgi:hypothetical protein